MDPTAQTPPADQSAGAPGTQQPQVPAPNPEEQKAIANGDIPMPVTTSQQAVQAQEAEQLQKINEVQNAGKVNDQQTQNDVTLNKSATTPAGDDKASDAASSVAEAAKPVDAEQKPADTKAADPVKTGGSGTKDKVAELQNIVDKTDGMPPAFHDLLNERLERLRLIGSSAGLLSTSFIMELEAATRYIDWSVKLPWDKKTEDVLDLAKAKAIMDKNHYGLEPLKQRVLEYIATVILNLKNNGDVNNVIKSPILCVVGLAGTGKTTFAKSLGETLGRSTERIPFGGMADSRVLRGQSRYFPDAEPGAVIKKLVHAQAKNPVILLDEVDRVTDSARADIMGVLIEILDPEQNAAFTDHYIDYPFSLQNVLFIATANNVSGVATAVLDRFEIIHMPSYNDDEKIHIGKFYVLPKSVQLTGLHPDQLTIDDDVWEGLVRPLGYDPGVRGLDRLITNMCRKAATMIVTGQATNVRITNDNVKSFLPEW